MTTEPTITCPNCSTEIKLTYSLAAPLVRATRKEYEAKLVQQEQNVAKREEEIRKQQQAVADTQKAIDDQVSQKLKKERLAITAEEAKKAKLVAAFDLEAKSNELVALQEVLKERNSKLEEAQKAQVELIRKHRELDDAKRELDLTVEKRVQESIDIIREKAKKEVEDSLKLKVAEKEEQISSMQRQIEELKRKAEQGSQQLQGEVLELVLEDTLKSKFPFDSIEPVAKGEFGGDVLQCVVGPVGQACGSIL